MGPDLQLHCVHGSGNCSNLNYVLLSCWNLILILGKHCAQCILYYTILYYRASLGGPIRARAARTVNIDGTLALWSGLLLRARHGFGLCCWALRRSGETAEEQTVSKHGSYR